MSEKSLSVASGEVPHDNDGSLLDAIATIPELENDAGRREWLVSGGERLHCLVQQVASIIRQKGADNQEPFRADDVHLEIDLPRAESVGTLMEEAYTKTLEFLADKNLSDRDALLYAGVFLRESIIHIHPYLDGNGKLSRLISLVLCHGSNISADAIDLSFNINNPGLPPTEKSSLTKQLSFVINPNCLYRGDSWPDIPCKQIRFDGRPESYSPKDRPGIQESVGIQERGTIESFVDHERQDFVGVFIGKLLELIDDDGKRLILEHANSEGVVDVLPALGSLLSSPNGEVYAQLMTIIDDEVRELNVQHLFKLLTTDASLSRWQEDDSKLFFIADTRNPYRRIGVKINAIFLRMKSMEGYKSFFDSGVGGNKPVSHIALYEAMKKGLGLIDDTYVDSELVDAIGELLREAGMSEEQFLDWKGRILPAGLPIS